MTEYETILSELRQLREDVTEIRDYIRHIQSSEYKNNEDVKQFAINLAANVLVDGMEENAKEGIRKKFDKE